MQVRNSTSRIVVTALLLCFGALTADAQVQDWTKAFDIHHLPAYLTAGLMITVFIMGFYNRVFYFKEREIRVSTKRMNARLGLVLESNKTHIWTFDVERNLYVVVADDRRKMQDYMPLDFGQFYQHDDFIQLRQQVLAIRDGQKEESSIVVRGRRSGDDNERNIYEVNLSVLRKDRNGKALAILGIERDTTEDNRRQQKAKEMLMRYHTLFYSSLVDMIYFDAEGNITDLNDKACETFDVKSREELVNGHHKIREFPIIPAVDYSEIDNVHASAIVEKSTIENPIGNLEKNWEDTIYYEASLSTLHNKANELTGLVMAGRNITEMVNSQHHQQEASRLLEKATHDIQEYIQNINYTLKASNVLLINYYPDSHEMTLSNDLNTTLYRFTQLRVVSLVDFMERRKVKGLFRRMDQRHEGGFSDTVQTIMHDEKGRNVYLNLHIMPIVDNNGHIIHYFGMLRNDTAAVYTERQLAKETQKAQETEQLKNTFLLNMSYELRTPLNALIGFAELFNEEHAVEDEPVFADQIKRNTNELLELVNDILFISRIDANMLDLNFQEADFAIEFDSFCYMGLGQVDPNVKVVIDNPYNHLMAKYDAQYLGMVIQKLCVIAATFTKEGTIRAKYEYHHGELAISVEDTGDGFDAATLPNAFTRFIRDNNNETCGTGLDLPIIKELVELMGGTIEIQSALGKGTSVYINMPCEVSSLEKKSEITV